jgi:hypothetical protein
LVLPAVLLFWSNGRRALAGPEGSVPV